MNKHYSDETINKSIVINARSRVVWEALTQPELMKKWMSETPIEVITDWKLGGPFIIQGESYKTGFRNSGVVLQFEEEHLLEYSYLSSLSKLSDQYENYTHIHFTLHSREDKTLLELKLNGFPTESTYKHIDYYWTIAIEVLKKVIEE